MRYVRVSLLILVALIYAGTAGAYTIDVVGPTSALFTDEVTVDIVVDTEGQAWYGVQMYVSFDPTVLSSVSGVLNYAPGMVPGYPYSSIYLYPTGPGPWFVMQSTLAAAPAFAGSIATLVFHVMDVPTSTMTVIDANFTAGPYGIFVGAGALDETGNVVVTDLTIHVPEPTTTMLMGLGLLGILYAGRRR